MFSLHLSLLLLCIGGHPSHYWPIENGSTYSCYCIDGYTGVQCQTNWDECWSSPCQNGAVCIDGVAHYNCSCPEGFAGQYCYILRLLSNRILLMAVRDWTVITCGSHHCAGTSITIETIFIINSRHLPSPFREAYYVHDSSYCLSIQGSGNLFIGAHRKDG